MGANRLTEIDDIRGISILVMILIHTNAYFLSVPLAFSTLEVSQFAVVAFIFCSAYLFFLKRPPFSWNSFISHLWKRIRRLVVPYYAYLAVYSVFLFIATPKKLTPAYFVQNISLTGGIDFNWLVLLFIELAVLMPVLLFLYSKHKTLYFLFMSAAFISSLVFLFYTPLPWYRFIMWLPWSLVLGYTLHLDLMKKDTRIFLLATVLFFMLFIASQQLVLLPFHRSLRMYDNKYPPNIYHLAYGFFGVNVLYFLSQKGVFKPLQKVIHFFSVYSYSIFFVHILVIYVLTVFMKIKFTWVTFFIATLAVTTVIQLGINALTSFLRYRGGRQSGYLQEHAN